MSKLSAEDVLKLARLSRLRLSESELSQFQSELGEIISYVEVLDSVDTEGLVPTYQVTGLTNSYRPDEISTTGPYRLSQGELLANAPNTENGLIIVKRVL